MKVRPLYITLAVGIILTFVLSEGCYFDKEDLLYPSSFCDTTSVHFYAHDVQPILQNNCLGCHNENANSGGVSLEPYAVLKPYADNGKLSCSINHGSECSAMPQNSGKLNACDIIIIDKWIADGALNN